MPIKAGETTGAKKQMRFFLAESADVSVGITGHTFTGSEITVCPPTASSFTAFAGVVVELGGGHYAYEPTSGELVTGGNQITIRVVVSGAVSLSLSDDVVAYDPQDPGGIGGAPSSADNAAAVLAAVLDAAAPSGAKTVQEVLNILAAYAAGNASGLPSAASGTITYKSMDGTTPRLVGTISSGVRTITSRNGD